TAIGLAQAGSVGLTSIRGVDLAPTDWILSYTVYGDANLDGRVNALDFNALATNFGRTGRLWEFGEFNYDGIVNTADFNLHASTLNETLNAQQTLGTIVPEPITTAPLVMLVGRR